MNAITQIICLSLSFLYGIFFYLIWCLHNLIINKQKRFFKSFSTILLMYIMVLIFIIMIYKVNNGIFHFYFLIMITLGFIVALKLKGVLLKNERFQKLVDKVKNKWYNKFKESK